MQENSIWTRQQLFTVQIKEEIEIAYLFPNREFWGISLAESLPQFC